MLWLVIFPVSTYSLSDGLPYTLLQIFLTKSYVSSNRLLSKSKTLQLEP